MSQEIRDSLPDHAFGLPKKREYPIDTRNRAINAKGRAKQQLKKGNLTKAEYNRIVKKANAYLKGCPKKKTTSGVTIPTVGAGCPLKGKFPWLPIAIAAGVGFLIYRATR